MALSTTLPLNPIAIPAYRNRWAVPLAVLVHVALVAGLLLSVTWKSEPPPALQAELWAALPSKPAATAATEPSPESAPAPAPIPAAVPTPKETEAIAPKQVKPEPKPKPAPVPKLEPKVEPKSEPKPPAKVEPKPMLKSEPKPDPKPDTTAQTQAAKEVARQKEIARMNQLLGGAPMIVPVAAPVQGTPQAGSAGGLGAGWGAKLKACVQPNLRYNDSGGDNPRVVVLVKLSPAGSPLDAQISKASGNATFDAAVLRALLRCDPFPKPESGSYPASLSVAYRLND